MKKLPAFPCPLKHSLFFFFSLLFFSSCRKEKDSDIDPTKSGELGISAITIALKDEKFTLDPPKTGTTASFANAPRSFHAAITSLIVNITPTDAMASVSKDGATFINGSAVDFTKPVNFTVKAQSRATKTYTIEVSSYNAASNPYGIYTAAHLSDMRNGLLANYKVMQDITLPDANEAGAAATGIADYATAGWKSVGGGDDFKGVLDGGGHKIDNFYTNRGTGGAGLLGTVGTEGNIKNLGVNGVTTKDFAAKGGCTGILASVNYGTIENCYATGNVSSASCAGGLVGFSSHGGQTKSSSEGGIISNCYATGNVSASCAGGLVGFLGNSIIHKVKISNCHATGNVTITSAYDYFSYAGGLVGYCHNTAGSISDCYATGNVSASSRFYLSVCGGLVGELGECTISNCHATGNVSCASYIAGGLVGEGHYGIDKSYATGNVSAYLYAGGLAGEGSTISNCYATGNVSASSYAAGGLSGRAGTTSNSYATGNVSSSSFTHSSSSSYAGGLVGEIDKNSVISNCYRNSDASITKDDAKVAAPDDEAIPGITPKTLAEMKIDAFKNLLNGTAGTAWGYSAGKNNDLPYLIGVGVGK